MSPLRPSASPVPELQRRDYSGRRYDSNLVLGVSSSERARSMSPERQHTHARRQSAEYCLPDYTIPRLHIKQILFLYPLVHDQDTVSLRYCIFLTWRVRLPTLARLLEEPE